VKGYPFEVRLSGTPASVVLADQVKSLDWRARKATKKGPAIPAELAAIPYDGLTMRGLLRKPAGIGRPPVLLMIPGLDSVKEELQATADHFLRRGIATLAIDGPGQGEMEFERRIEPAYEKPAGAAIDWLEKRDDVDASRVGVYGVSLGGYYAVRVAAIDALGRYEAAAKLSAPVESKALAALGTALAHDADGGQRRANRLDS